MLKIIMFSGILSSIIKLPIIGILPTGNIKNNTGISDSKKDGKQRRSNLGISIYQLPSFLYSLINNSVLYSLINNSVPSNKPIPPEEIKLIKMYLLKSCI
ncbi:hypothetical protein RZ847_014980 [Clostridioides difficile]|nr:hypothetical protein [Clostridioides difficile]